MTSNLCSRKQAELTALGKKDTPELVAILAETCRSIPQKLTEPADLYLLNRDSPPYRAMFAYDVLAERGEEQKALNAIGLRSPSGITEHLTYWFKGKYPQYDSAK